MSTWDTSRNAAGHLAFSNNDQTVTYTGTAGWASPAFSVNFHSTSKWVARFSVITEVLSNTVLGFGTATSPTTGGGSGYLGIDSTSLALNDGGGWGLNNVFTSSGSSGYGPGFIVDIAIDLDGQLAWNRINGGTWFGNGVSGDPDAGTNGFSISGLASLTVSPGCQVFGGTPNDSIDIGVQTSSTETFQPWDGSPPGLGQWRLGSVRPGDLLLASAGCAVAKAIERNGIITRRKLILPHKTGQGMLL